MDSIPPGVHYLIQRAHKLTAPPLLTYFAFRYYLAPTYGVQYPALHSAWTLACALIGSLPSTLALAVLWSEVRIRVDAARKGAIMPPRLGDWSPGNIMTVIKNIREFEKKYPGDGFDQLCKQHGCSTFNARVLFENRLITAEPDIIKAILATQFDEFEKGPETRTLFYPLLGTGVFAADGDLWKFHRSMTRPFFSRERISHFDNFDRHAEDAITQLKSRLREGHPVDFQDLVARFTLDSATEFLFGNDVGSLSGGLPYPYYIKSGVANTDVVPHLSSRFVGALAEAQMITARRMGLGVHWPLMEFWHDKLKGPMRVVHEFIDPIVAEAISRKRASVGHVREKDDETLLENLVNSTEDPITLRDEIMSLLVAGRDTTASTLTFIVYMLAEHPKVLQRLREEVLERVGPQRRPTYDDFRDMKYLRAVINGELKGGTIETLRLYPAV
uniref:Cytochrome P450 n=1 Tax=Psilocybe cubensis TaxID=181762 RepID=A0A8H7XXV3_PSICU